MTMTVHAAAPGPLGAWVESHSEPCRDGRTYRLLVNHRTGRVIELSDTEAEICGRLRAGRTAGDGDAAGGFVAELRELGFLASDPPPPPGRAVQVSGARLDLRWTGAGRLVTAAYGRGARHLFRPAAVAMQILLALAGLAAVLAGINPGQHFVLRVSPVQIPLAIGLSLAAVGVHELAHALVVVRHGRTVDAAGIRLHLGAPAFYVESASAVLLTRRQRLIQAAAGAWAEWQFTSVLAVWLWLAPPSFALPIMHRFVILNAVTILSNLLPFTGLDGSWLLADAAGIPDLSRRARGGVTRLITAVVARQPRSSGDLAIAAYAAVNGVVAAVLLVTAWFFWYQLFGGLVSTLVRQGPAGPCSPRPPSCSGGRLSPRPSPGCPIPSSPPAGCATRSSSACSGAGASRPPPGWLPRIRNWPGLPARSSASLPVSYAAPVIAARCPPAWPAATESSAPGPPQPRARPGSR